MKNFVKFFVGSLISLLLVVLLSCGEDAGLGSTVDTEAPKLSISYPPAAAYVRGEFVFAGTCSDDKGVTRVEVTVKNLDTGKTYDTVFAKIENSLTWRININKQTASGFELSDGKYMLEVTAYDKSGRSSGTSSRQFDIDNTPPVFVITKPGVNRKVYLSENSISKYGSLFAIEGTIADDHDIASMDVTIYDKDGNPVASEPYSEKEISTTGGTSVTIARFIENGVDASNLRYNEIYSVGDADASGNKVYSCTVTVADSTKEYKNPGDNGTECGNSTSVVYLYDDVYDEYMSAKKGAGLSANDFRTVLNGTATNESLSGKGIATDVTVEKVLAALKNFAKDTTNIEDNSLSFSLNPNADPTYNISGFNLNYNEAGTAIAAGTNKAMGEQPLTVIVSQGLDNVPIVPKSLKIYIKKIIEADKAHITKNALNKSISDLVTKVSELEIDLANASESLDTEKQKEAEAQLSVIDGWNLLLDNSEDNSPSEATYTLSLTLPANNYIEANAYYAIVVTGNDKDGIKLSQTKNFGFMGTISAVPPSASFTSPADNQFFANSKAETLSFTGTATENNAGMTLRKITAILTASDESTGKEVDGKVEVTIEGNSDKIWENVPGLSCYYDEEEKTNKWTFTPALCNGYDTLMAEKEGLQYAYKATIKVTGTGELTAETSRSIKIDTKKPVVAITSVAPVVSGKEYFGEDSQYSDYTFINSIISIQGSITENNLSSVTYDVRASADLNADLSDEKYSILAGLKEFSEKNGEIVVDGDLGRISSIEQKFHTDLITNYLIASKQISKDQPVKARIVLRAKDLVGNVGEYNSSESNEGKDFFVYQETDRPKVTLGNSELSYKVGETTKSLLVDEKDENKGNINYEHNLFGTTNNNKLSLSFTDDDSVVEYDIFIAKNGKDFAKDANYTATPNKTSASVNFVLPEEEGVYKVKVVARDFLRSEAKTDATQVYGVQVIGPFYIAVDSGAPTLNLSNPQNGAFVSRNSGIDGGVKGTVSKKGTKISGFIYKLGDTTKTQLITVTDVTIDEENPVNEVYNWTGKITRMPEKEQGDNFKLEITSLDAYGQSSTISANLGIDETAPVVKLNADEETQILESNPNYSVKDNKKRYLVSGTWSDVGTGTSELYCAYANEVENNEPKWIYLNGTKEGSEDPKPVEGTANSTAETSFNIYIPLTEGASFAYKVWGKDAAGNITTPSEEDGTLVKGITVDLGTPTIEKTSGDVPQYVKKDGTLTITGKAEDSYGLKDIVANVKLNGEDVASKKKGDTGYTGYTFTPVIAEDKKSGTFTIQLVADDENNGAWTFEIHAVDLAGRESGTLNYNTVVDTIAPSWIESEFKVNKEARLKDWYSASSLPFEGAYKEEGSGIGSVKYTITLPNGTIGTAESFGTSKDANDSRKEKFSTNLGEFKKKVEDSDNNYNTVSFVAVDKAGNESEEKKINIYIDTESPSLESLLTGSQYSNQTTPFEFTGTASDDSSGIAGVELKVYEDGNPIAIPDPNDPNNDAIPAIGTGAAGENDYSSWAATIPVTRLKGLASKPHSVKATVTDVAGNKTTLTIFKINVDKDFPTISNISFTNTSEKYSVYQTEETVTGSTEKIATYYVHNNDGNKFSIYGSIMDQTSGIKKIELLEGTVSIIPESVASLPITNIDFAGRTGSANLTLKATDNAGNVTEFPLVVKFDNNPPMGIHAIDKSNKDIFFRISDLNNWKWDGTEGEIENWDASLDEDIGGKYSSTSFGKNETVRVRGNISDKESGVDMIYYKVISAGTDAMAQENTTNAAGETVKGLVNIAKEFLENYKNDNNGYFRANKIEEKRITYTSIGEADKVYDTNGNLVVLRGTDETKKDGTGTIFEGLVKNFGACHGQDTVNDSPKNYATVTTNYDNSFTGFKNGYNYLILVAVDNVGNASLDTVNVVYGGTTTQYNNFSLNVDTVTPELQSKQSGQLLTNGSDDLPLNGTFTDNFAGVKTIVLDLINTSTKNTVKTFTLDSSSESPDANNPNSGFLTTSGTWGIPISQNDLTALDTAVYSVKATVTDRAGNQWPQNIFTIQKDATPPEITNVKLTQQSSTYKIYKPNENVDEYYVNPSDGNFTIEGGATDNYGIKKIELVIPGYSGTITPVEDKGSFEFKELDLSTLTGNEVTVTLKVTDTAGNTLATDKTIKLVFDKTSPSWNADDFKINERAFDSGTDAKNWFKDSLLTFAGSYTEEGAGIEKVIYEITKAGGEGALPQGSFATTALTGTNAGKETFTSNLSGFVQKTGDTGDDYNIVKLWAVDKVGNKNSTPMEFLIYIDTEAPKVTSNNSEILYTNGEGKLKKVTGTVTDNAAGISSIKVSANGKELTEGSNTNGTLSITKTDSKNWTWEAEVNGEVFKESNGTVKDGNLTISAIVVDDSGNDRSVAVANIIVDGTNPSVTLTSPTDADSDDSDVTQINGTITLSGTINDSNVLPDTAITGIEYSTDKTNWTPLTLYQAADTTAGTQEVKGLKLSGNYTFKAEEFDTTTLDDETLYYLRAVAKDTAGNTGYSYPAKDSKGNDVEPVTVKISQDSDRPVFKITNITDLGEGSAPRFALKYGTKSQLVATVTDDDGIAEVVVSENSYTGTETKTGTTEFNNGSAKFTPSNEMDGRKTFYVYVKDINGKKFYTTYNYTSPTGVNESADEVARKKTLGQPKIKVNDNRVTAFDGAAFSYNADSNSPTVGDIKALAYKSDETTPNGAERTSDDGKTVIKDVFEQVTASYTVGGTEKRWVQFEINASDASDIAGITLEVSYDKKDGSGKQTDKYCTPGYTATGYDENGSKEAQTYKVDNVDVPGMKWTTGKISLENAKTGNVTLKITPYDKLSLVGNGNITFAVDNSGPEIKVTNPASEDEVTGTVSFVGTAIDKGGSSAIETKWLIPTKAQQAESYSDSTLVGDTWFDTGFTSKSTASAWEFDLQPTVLSTYDNSTDYAISSANGVYVIPFYILSKDSLGNCTIKRDYKFRHNPDADRPRTTISYPEVVKDDAGTITVSTLGGTIRVTGDAIIPQGDATVKAVYLQIGTASSDGKTVVFEGTGNTVKTKIASAVKEDGTKLYPILTLDGVKTALEFDSINFASNNQPGNDWWGIPVTRTGSTWNFSINTNGELDPASDDTTHIALRAIAINTGAKMGAWTDTVLVDIDANAPRQTATLRQYSGGINATNVGSNIEATTADVAKKYDSGMYLKGDNWYLTVQLDDESEIHTYTVKKGNSELAKTDYFASTCQSVTVGTNTSAKRQYLFIPVDLSKDSVEYTVSVTDTETNGHTIDMTYKLNIDNTAPEIQKLYHGSTSDSTDLLSDDYEIKDSDYIFQMGGKIKEEGSGFDRVVFYYIREGKAILNPLIPASSTNGTADSKVSLSDSDDIKQGETTYKLWGTNVTGTIKADGFTFVASSSLDNAHIRIGGLIKLAGIYRKITKVAGTTVEFDTSTGVSADVSGQTAFFPYAQVVDNTNLEKLKTTAGYAANPFSFSNNSDDGDEMPEEVTGSKGIGYTWNATIHSTNIPDGPAKLVVLAFDKAGNVTGTQYNVKVVNSAPRLAKVFLGTDLNSNGVWTADEFVGYNLYNANKDVGIGTTEVKEKQIIATASYESKTPFSVKDKLAVVPEFVGGNGEIIMVYKKDAELDTKTVDTETVEIPKIVQKNDGILGSKNSGVATLIQNATGLAKVGKVTYNGKSDVATKLAGFTLTSNDVAGLGATDTLTTDNGNIASVPVSFTFWDSTEETTPGETSQNCVLHISDLNFALKDNVPPEAKIIPFHWTSASDNSLYENSAKNGHIELEKDWEKAPGYDSTKDEFDKDPKVSGKIVLTGTAYDNKMLKEIKVKMDGFKFATAAQADSDNPAAGEYVTVAEYKEGSDANKTYSWSANNNSHKGSLTDYGWEFFVDTDDLGQSGHTVSWKLYLDTENATAFADVAKTDCAFIVQAVDASGSTGTEKSDDTGTTNTAYTYEAGVLKDRDANYTSYYRMDVVPYITGIETLLARNAGTEVARSAKGYYSVYAGETITISGFNLKKGKTAPVLYIGDSNTALTTSAANSSKTNVIAKVESAAVSGEVKISVSSVVSLNNQNASPIFTAGATDADSNSSAMYNSMANTTNNKRLTDDVKLYVWENGFFKQDVRINAPTMKMDSDGNYYMIYDNNTREFDGTEVYGFQLVLTKNETKGGYIDGSYNKFHNTAIAIYNGNPYGAATNTDRVNNNSARFKYYTWAGRSANSYDRGAYQKTETGYSLEMAYNAGTQRYDINRVPTPKMVADSNGNMYMSYFDANHSKNPVKFRYGNGLKQNADATYMLESDNRLNYQYSSTAPSFHVVADDSMTYKGGKYSAVGVTSGGVAVIAWYDASARRLVYSYNTAPNTPVYGEAWQSNAQVIDDSYAGQYVDLFVDSNDGIHIAYYVNSSGDLKYAYLPSYDFELTDENRANHVVTVDAYLSAGTNITINTKEETVGSTTYIVPYIAYQNASFIQTTSPIRVAWLPKAIEKGEKGADQTVPAGAVGNFFTEGWEVVAVPTTNIPTESMVCSGVPTGKAGGIGNGKSPVLAFMSDAGYESAYIKY